MMMPMTPYFSLTRRGSVFFLFLCIKIRLINIQLTNFLYFFFTFSVFQSSLLLLLVLLLFVYIGISINLKILCVLYDSVTVRKKKLIFIFGQQNCMMNEFLTKSLSFRCFYLFLFVCVFFFVAITIILFKPLLLTSVTLKSN